MATNIFTSVKNIFAPKKEEPKKIDTAIQEQFYQQIETPQQTAQRQSVTAGKFFGTVTTPLDKVSTGGSQAGKAGKKPTPEKETITIESAQGKAIPLEKLKSPFAEKLKAEGKGKGFITFGPEESKFVFVGGKAERKTEIPRIIAENILEIRGRGREAEVLLYPGALTEKETTNIFYQPIQQEYLPGKMEKSIIDFSFDIGKDFRQMQKGTIIGGDYTLFGGQIYVQPTLVEKQIDMWTSPMGEKIPTTQIFYVDPFGESMGRGAFKLTERPATEEEKLYFKGFREEIASEKKKPLFFDIKENVLGTYGAIKSSMAETKLGFFPTQEELFGKPGEISSAIVESQEKIPSWLRLKGWEQKAGTFELGIVGGLYGEAREKPFKQVALFGLGAGLGYGIGGVSVGLGAIPKIGTALAVSFKGATIAGGLYLGAGFVSAKVGEFMIAPSWEEKGAISAITAKDIGLIGFGYAKGQKWFTQTRGWWGTRGREELILPQGEYPTAPARKQLELFRKNVIEELGTKPGALHVTEDIFWKGKIIQPGIGTSELPGLYGSTQISTPFTRISGSGAKTKLFPSLKDLLAPPGKPGIAYLKPEEFRYSPYGISKTPVFEGQQAIRGKYAYWKLPSKPGYADVPLLKAEIEAVFRPEAGKYLFESGKYYATVKGVRVPIDVFGYEGIGKVSPAGKIVIPLKAKVYSPSSYVLPSLSYKKITPQSVGLMGLTSKDISSGISSKILKSYTVSSLRPSSVISKSLSYSFVGPSSISSSIKKSSRAIYPSMKSSAVSRALSSSIVSGVPYIPYYPPAKKYILPPFPFLGAPQKTEKINLKRLFKRIPSFASLELEKVGREMKGLELTGIAERPLLKPLRKTKLTLGALGPIKI